jgi:hypothetical protein
LLGNRAYVASMAADWKSAIRYNLDAIALGEKVAPGSPVVNVALGNVCLWMNRANESASAYPYCANALERDLKSHGARSHFVGDDYTDLSRVELVLNRPAEALADAVRAVDVYEGSADGPALAQALDALGAAQIALGRSRVAVSTLERALELAVHSARASASSAECVADIEGHLAQALWNSGERSPRVDSLVRESLETYRRVDPQSHRLRDMEQWAAARSL